MAHLSCVGGGYGPSVIMCNVCHVYCNVVHCVFVNFTCIYFTYVLRTTIRAPCDIVAK